MENNFRNVLIILSAIVITAIFIHGLWTIRKQKNPYKLKTSKSKTDPITRDFDQKGFDQDGVGQIKVNPNVQNDRVNIKGEAVTEQEEKAKPEKVNNSPVQILDSSLEGDWFKENNSEKFAKDESDVEFKSIKRPLNEGFEQKSTKPKAPVNSKPLYEQPVTQAKVVRAPINTVNKTPSKTILQGEKVDIDSQVSNKSTISDEINTQLEPQVIILSVIMPDDQQILGAALLPSLLTLGLKYGEMNIFHRHEDNTGKGKVTFSLANVMNPGSFDLDSMENFATRGVSLFMTLPNAADPFYVFEQMLNAAKQLAQEFNAQIIDDKRNVMTKQTEQRYLNKIREFDRKSRI